MNAHAWQLDSPSTRSDNELSTHPLTIMGRVLIVAASTRWVELSRKGIVGLYAWLKLLAPLSTHSFSIRIETDDALIQQLKNP